MDFRKLAAPFSELPGFFLTVPDFGVSSSWQSGPLWRVVRSGLGLPRGATLPDCQLPTIPCPRNVPAVKPRPASGDKAWPRGRYGFRVFPGAAGTTGLPGTTLVLVSFGHPKIRDGQFFFVDTGIVRIIMSI